MTVASLLLYLAAGLTSHPGVEFTPQGQKILTDTLWVSQNFHVPAESLLAQSYHESRHKWWAMSEKREDGYWDTGFMQPNVKYLDEFVLEFERTTKISLDSNEKYQVNIMLGGFLMGKYLREFRSLPKALMAYNGGAPRVRTGKVLPEVREYAERVQYYTRSDIFYQEVLPSYLCSVFQLDNGKPLTVEWMRKWMWESPTIKMRGITTASVVKGGAN